MRSTNLLVASNLAILCLLAGHQAMAQNATSGAVQGQVTDQATGQPLAGVTIVVTSPSLQGTQSAITEESGQYKITNLPPGTYQVTFYYSDITVQRTNITVSINRTTPVPVKIDTSRAGGEKIIIDDKAPNIDPTSTTQGFTIDQDYTENIPVPGRTFEDALGVAAGSANDGVGVSFSGSTSLENQYIIDGVNTTGITYGTVGSPLINEFIEQIEIITGAYNAEFGRATGGVVNVLIPSGSNEFEGSVFGYMRPGFLIAQTERTPTQSTSLDVENNLAYDADFGFRLGGPIIKDKVWFFVGFAPRLVRANIDRITKRRTDCRVVQDDGTLSPCDPAMHGNDAADIDPETGFFITDELDRQRLHADATSYQFVSKVNFAVSPEHQGHVSLIGTPSSGDIIGIAGEPGATRFDVTYLTTDLSTKWTSKFNNNKTEVEAVLGWHRSTARGDSIDDSVNQLPHEILLGGDLYTWGQGRESMRTLTGCRDIQPGEPIDYGVDPYPSIVNCPDDGVVGYRIGGPGGILDDSEQRLSARLGVIQRVKAVGNHEIKAGVDIEDNRLNRRRVLSGGVLYENFIESSIRSQRWVQLSPVGADDRDNLCYDQGELDAVMYPCDYVGPDGIDVEGQTINWSAYLRDSWQILPNLTLNAGIRYEEQRLRYAADLQDTLDPFTNEERGTNAMLMRNMWAPRLGAIYDWTKEGRSKIYGHYGRYYESIPMDINDRSFGGETLLYQVYNTDQCGESVDNIGGPSGTGCDEVGEEPSIDQQLLGSGVLVAPGIKPQYLDELVLGVEYELIEDLKVGIAYKNRRLGRVIEDVSTDGADTYILANPGEWSQDEEDKLLDQIDSAASPEERARLEALLEQYRGIRIFDPPRRDYNAIEMIAVKRFSRSFFLQGSYTYSRTLGNFPGLFSADNGQIDPNITSQYDLIELMANRDGPLPQDRPHYFKLDGYYTYDFKRYGELTSGVRFRALSGTPVNALGRHHLYGFDESFLLPRGAVGRTDFDAGVDIRLIYSRDLGRGMRLVFFTDLFNVFNRQGEFNRDQTYTLDPANPIVGGDYEDLIWLKQQSESGQETSEPVERYLNFRNTAVRYAPFSARLGARLDF